MAGLLFSAFVDIASAINGLLVTCSQQFGPRSGCVSIASGHAPDYELAAVFDRLELRSMV
jgi:hypothetical protein